MTCLLYLLLFLIHEILKDQKKKVHSTGDEAHYKYIFEMGRWGQT